MKKNLSIALLLFVSFLQAETKYFVGGNFTNYTSKASGFTHEIEHDSDEISFKIGLVDSDKRFYIQVGDIYDRLNMKFSSTSLNFDKFINISTITRKLMPFIGIGISYDKASIPWDDYPGTKSTSDKALGYLIRTGTLFTLDSHQSIEVGYVYAKSKLEQKWTDTIGSSTYSRNIHDVSYDGFYLGYNFQF